MKERLKGKPEDKRVYTDKEINDLADWYQDLTIAQLMYIKEAYQQSLLIQAQEIQRGVMYVQ